MTSVYRLAKFGWFKLPAGTRLRLRSMDLFNSFIRRASMILDQHADDEDIYSEEYFRMVEQTSGQSADVMAASIVNDLHPEKVVDVGCGTGVLLERLRNLGVRGMGLEHSEIALRMCKDRSLNVRRFDLERDALISLAEADVAVCLEVASLIPEVAADRCVELLCTAGVAVVFSAGTTGQGGAHVRNEQQHRYWGEKFARHGFCLINRSR